MAEPDTEKVKEALAVCLGPLDDEDLVSGWSVVGQWQWQWQIGETSCYLAVMLIGYTRVFREGTRDGG